MLLQAQQRQQAGDLQAAIALYQSVLKAQPKHPDVHFFLGHFLLQVGELSGAEFHLQTSLKLFPTHTNARAALGQLYFKSSQWDKAKAVFEKLVKTCPDNADYEASLGACLLKLNDPDAAESHLNKALTLHAHHPVAVNNLASASFALSKIEASLRYYEHACELFPRNLSLRTNLLMTMNYSELVSAQTLFDAHKNLASVLPAPDDVPYKTKKKIRLGFVSADFRRHSVSFFALPLFEAMARNRFELYASYNKQFEDAGVAAIIYTDIDRDGILTGLNIESTLELARAVSIPVIASGGLASIGDVKRLAEEDCAILEGAISGRALYDGRLDPDEAIAISKQTQKVKKGAVNA